jgi:hypothetical protein
MERPPMVIDWQNKYYENAHSIESNLQIQAMSIKILLLFFVEIEKPISKLIWKNKTFE